MKTRIPSSPTIRRRLLQPWQESSETRFEAPLMILRTCRHQQDSADSVSRRIDGRGGWQVREDRGAIAPPLLGGS